MSHREVHEKVARSFVDTIAADGPTAAAMYFTAGNITERGLSGVGSNKESLEQVLLVLGASLALSLIEENAAVLRRRARNPRAEDGAS